MTRTIYGDVNNNIKQGNKFYYLGAFKFLFADNSQNAITRFYKSKKDLLKSLKEKGLEGTENDKFMNNIHEWCAEGIKPEIQNLQGLSSNIFTWWMVKIYF